MPTRRVLAGLVNLVNDRLTATIVAALRADGVRAIVLKGASIREWLYEEHEERLSGDIDLLVPHSACDQVDACLRTLALRYLGPSKVGHGRAYVRLWEQPQTGALVELHQSISGIAADDASAWRVLSERTTLMPIDGEPAEVLDLPPALCTSPCTLRTTDRRFLGRSRISNAASPRSPSTRGARPRWLRISSTRFRHSWPGCGSLAAGRSSCRDSAWLRAHRHLSTSLYAQAARRPSPRDSPGCSASPGRVASWSSSLRRSCRRRVSCAPGARCTAERSRPRRRLPLAAVLARAARDSGLCHVETNSRAGETSAERTTTMARRAEPRVPPPALGGSADRVWLAIRMAGWSITLPLLKRVMPLRRLVRLTWVVALAGAPPRVSSRSSG